MKLSKLAKELLPKNVVSALNQYNYFCEHNLDVSRGKDQTKVDKIIKEIELWSFNRQEIDDYVDLVFKNLSQYASFYCISELELL